MTSKTNDPSTGALQLDVSKGDSKDNPVAAGDPMQPLYQCQRIVAESSCDLRTVKAAILDGDFTSTTARMRVDSAVKGLGYDVKAIKQGLERLQKRDG